ncbi:MAG: hypothetical protein SFU25_01580, partial [Candidatus Caenarcaniphilales bacterium]|nr:hypothetical protein [Candidatus Caenarcaniphilales bacterium]
YEMFLEDLNRVLNEIQKEFSIPVFLFWKEIDHHQDEKGIFGPAQRIIRVSQRQNNFTVLYNNPHSPSASLEASILDLAYFMKVFQDGAYIQRIPRATLLNLISDVIKGVLDDIGFSAFGIIPEGIPNIAQHANNSEIFNQLFDWIQDIPVLAGFVGGIQSVEVNREFYESHPQALEELRLQTAVKMHQEVLASKKINDLPVLIAAYEELIKSNYKGHTYKNIKKKIQQNRFPKSLAAKSKQFLQILEDSIVECPAITHEIMNSNQESEKASFILIESAQIPAIEALKQVIKDNNLSDNQITRAVATVLEKLLFIGTTKDLNDKESIPKLLAVFIKLNKGNKKPFYLVTGRSSNSNTGILNTDILTFFNVWQDPSSGSSIGSKDKVMAAGSLQLASEDTDWWERLNSLSLENLLSK